MQDKLTIETMWCDEYAQAVVAPWIANISYHPLESTQFCTPILRPPTPAHVQLLGAHHTCLGPNPTAPAHPSSNHLPLHSLPTVPSIETYHAKPS